MIVIDCEMSGLEDTKRYGLISIAAFYFHEPENKIILDCQLPKDKEADPKTVEWLGMTEAQMRRPDRIPIYDAIGMLYDWAHPLKDKTLAGCVPANDVAFLKSAAERGGRTWRFGHRTVDLHTVAYGHMASRNDWAPLTDKQLSAVGLDEICAYVGIPKEPSRHKAINGAYAAGECFSRLWLRRNLIASYKSYPLPSHV
jgi:DNA polymerase III epsilon subunit-like protein